ncbi:MiaB/RimO family radical SAM methylthiotransferase [bacterium]|nr:MAG: MiaB/RimO family radical SAM methylthiotransferase [bacterium]
MKTYHIITFGCQMNFSDSERIETILKSQGLSKIPSKHQADLVVIVTCAVRQHAIDRIYGNIGEIIKKNPKAKIIVSGCLLDYDKTRLKKFKNTEIKSLTDFISPDADINKFLSTPPSYSHKDHASVPIMTGCNNFCSYCVVPYTRGREYSRPVKDILHEITQLTKNGCKEILLLGQNVNSYQVRKSIKSKVESPTPNSSFLILNSSSDKITFPELLKQINDIPNNFKLRFMTSHPKDMSDGLIDAIADLEKVDKEFLHLPVQSGNNEILKKMNRQYTVEHYKELIKKIRDKVPDIKISTDVIVGFPGETKKQFDDTLKLFQEIGFSNAYISCYSVRSGTVAEKMNDNVLLEEKKNRASVLQHALNKKL